jgi:uncharacterized protein YpbB
VRHAKEILDRPLKPRRLETAASKSEPRLWRAPKKEKKPDTVVVTRELLEKDLSIEEIAAARKLKIGTIIDHCEKIKKKDPSFDFSGLARDVPSGKMIQMKAALKKCKTESGGYSLSPAMELLAGAASYEELRLARLFL